MNAMERLDALSERVHQRADDDMALSVDEWNELDAILAQAESEAAAKARNQGLEEAAAVIAWHVNLNCPHCGGKRNAFDCIRSLAGGRSDG